MNHISWIFLIALIELTQPFAGLSQYWTHWSSWSDCTQHCGTGVKHRLCHGNCQGDNMIQYSTCNNQPCPEGSISYRAQQCATFNNLPLDGVLYAWVPSPVVDEDKRCSLRCTAVGHSSLHRTFADSVLDGTKCDLHSNNICITGKCIFVGCDYKLHSTKKLDICGVCGGDNSSCAGHISATRDTTSTSSTFEWFRMTSSACSVTCGVGHHIYIVVCRQSQTHAIVDNSFCENIMVKPEASLRSVTCRKPDCNAQWLTDAWEPCSKSCGGGLSKRDVYCTIHYENGTVGKTRESMCQDRKPDTQHACQELPCPEWHVGQWSQCSVTCGIGTQHRPVVCRHAENSSCPLTNSPVSSRDCIAAVPCKGVNDSSGEAGRHLLYSSQTKKDINDLPHAHYEEFKSSNVELERQPFDDWDEFLDDDDAKENDDYVDSNLNMFPYEELGASSDVDYGSGDTRSELWFSLESDETKQLRGHNKSASPSYYVTAWSHCSTTCGAGVRYRTVQCRAHVDSKRELPDKMCPGPRPPDNETCSDRPCGNLTTDDDRHQWRFVRYSVCSKSCLGGFQETVYVCVRLRDARPITDSTCSDLPKPNITREVCNDIPCPPRWHLEEYGDCSLTCGRGNQARLIKCLQAQKSDNGQTDSVLVPDENCPSPPPPSTRPCNEIDCPPGWTFDKWTQCSVTCGDGVQRRTVMCEQRTKFGKLRKAIGCDSSTIPDTAQSCVVPPPCPTATPPHVKPNSTQVIAFVQTRRRKRVLFNAHGRATLIPGTHLIIRCPLFKHMSNPRLIQWRRQHRRIPRRARVRGNRRSRLHIDKSGRLHIDKSRYSDAQLYRCTLDGASENVTLTFYSVAEAARRRRVRRPYVSANYDFYRRLRAEDKRRRVRHRKGYTFESLLRLCHNNISSLPFYFLAGEWSACSDSCGGGGLQTREITCELNLRRYYLVVADAYCEQRAKMKPLETRDCGFHTCAKWRTGRWSKCQEDRCLRNGFATIDRPLFCIADNGSSIDIHQCELNSMPEHIRECPSEHCQAKWVTSEWTQCSRICGGRGIRSRTIQCVWTSKYGKEYPAGIHCSGLPRPSITTVCHTPLCTAAACTDESDFCTLVPMLKLCRYDEYRRKCCRSCYKSSEIYKYYRP